MKKETNPKRLSDLLADDDFMEYIRRIAGKNHAANADLCGRLIGPELDDFVNEALYGVVEAWRRRPGQKKGFYGVAAGNHLNNVRRTAYAKKRDYGETSYTDLLTNHVGREENDEDTDR